MAEETVIKPDLEFIERLQGAGGESLKKCFQCATCSAVCNLTPDSKPFPRKEMIQAQWGLKDQLMKDPDIWLCHFCGDCTAYCPRGAKPGETLGAIRQMCIEHYAYPSFLGRMVNEPKYLPLLIAFPVLLLLGVLKFLGNLRIPEGEIIYAKLIPPFPYIDAIFLAAAAFAIYAFFQGVRRYWQDLNVDPWKIKLKENKLGCIIEVVKDIFFHSRFRKCVVHYSRSTSHLLVFLSFVGLFIVTAMSAHYEWIMHKPSPHSLSDPLKVLALASTIALLIGIWLVIRDRQETQEQAGPGSYFDWLFIWVVAVVGVTGALSWLLRLMGLAILAYPTYFLHLTSVFFLFFYAPYSKMAHMVYRTTAMLYAKLAERE
jgi:quinone-modifying oxidoreductase subunit QmoC